MPPAIPKVIVTFYENLHFEDVDVSKVTSDLVGSVETDPVSGDRFIRAKVKVVAKAGTWLMKFRFDAEQQGETEALPFNVGASAIEAALEAAASVGEFDVVAIGPQEFRITMWERDGATFFEEGMNAATIDLSGVLESQGFWDEVEYEVPLEYGCGIEPPKKPEVNSEGDNSSAKPTDHPVTGKNA